MRVCMVSPHLPPEQAAVALLPVMLGDRLSASNVVTKYVSHPTSTGGVDRARDVTYVGRRGRGRLSRSKLGAVAAGARMILRARRVIADSDIVHLHSNGLLIEVGAWLATRFRKPYVITLYGTDVSAHDAERNARFASVVRRAAARIFYSRGLLDQAASFGMAPEPSSVIYAPVGSDFRTVDDDTRATLRRELGAGAGPVMLTVKHLRPVGGHDTLLKAMPAILKQHPAAVLWLAGDGDLRAPLESLCRDLGIASSVKFLGRVGNERLWKYYASADLFVLPSHVESWGTVMLESIACGTPIVTTDTVGGLEVRASFPDEVTVVPKEDSRELASAVAEALKQPHRVTPPALTRVQRDFSVAACEERYLDVYRKALSSSP